SFILFRHSTCPHKALPSFPTRRSSDLSSDLYHRKSPYTPACEHPRAPRLSRGSARGSHARWMEPAAWLSNQRHNERWDAQSATRSEEHTSELQSQSNLVCRLLLEKKKK